jgi:hypothetical protein
MRNVDFVSIWYGRLRSIYTLRIYLQTRHRFLLTLMSGNVRTFLLQLRAASLFLLRLLIFTLSGKWILRLHEIKYCLLICTYSKVEGNTSLG